MRTALCCCRLAIVGVLGQLCSRRLQGQFNKGVNEPRRACFCEAVIAAELFMNVRASARWREARARQCCQSNGRPALGRTRARSKASRLLTLRLGCNSIIIGELMPSTACIDGGDHMAVVAEVHRRLGDRSARRHPQPHRHNSGSGRGRWDQTLSGRA